MREILVSRWPKVPTYVAAEIANSCCNSFDWAGMPKKEICRAFSQVSKGGRASHASITSVSSSPELFENAMTEVQAVYVKAYEKACAVVADASRRFPSVPKRGVSV